jgi:hypothetical protein
LYRRAGVDLHQDREHLIGGKRLRPAKVQEVIREFLGGQVGKGGEVQRADAIPVNGRNRKQLGAEIERAEMVEGMKRGSADVRGAAVDGGSNELPIDNDLAGDLGTPGRDSRTIRTADGIRGEL